MYQSGELRIWHSLCKVYVLVARILGKYCSVKNASTKYTYFTSVDSLGVSFSGELTFLYSGPTRENARMISCTFPAQVSRRVGCGCVRCGVETVDLENIRWLGMVYADVKRCLTSPLFSTPLFLEKRATNSFFPFAVKSGLRPEGDGSTLYTFWSQEFLCRLSGRFVLRRAYVSLFWTYKRECTNDLLYCVLRSLLTYLTGSFLRKCPDELENIRWLGMVYADVQCCLTSPLFSTPLFLEKRATDSFFPLRRQISGELRIWHSLCKVYVLVARILENIRWLGMVYADVQCCLTSPLFSTPLFLEKRATDSFFPLRRQISIRSGRKNSWRAYVSLFWTYKRECTNDLLYCVLRSLLTYLTGSFLRKCPDELGVAVCDAVWKPLI
ncbi:hypothetical protein PHYBLDRAFT_150784 [Phycomyces blakesleeanus NRRL 1555(-)]|uniref:Uncharacterized protein n=1 Tax=Phycomyces blakesleeanus (strain ATCC 8743b / DSM 1359 / FGSC 10004 / NBRC 33097 / NRRL 1555) TaxID=763407 RepID=A0A167KHL4_PHYB8|nr:hypothetical protein PHYBLDRAFT_150784 [Phycomyces blakesleeanus NRRL 1555(-)]OAD68119.1 hypothetical protein PHYBLDRAFT_150784 [Phycomyces blakesleeanus NRRL 1555(-)]|eukprot:XP_018286159.1 hypothetical protein PHYBLDRAFT_150784 [Phycomyces blakesleeanus NRRL 1555(-)]